MWGGPSSQKTGPKADSSKAADDTIAQGALSTSGLLPRLRLIRFAQKLHFVTFIGRFGLISEKICRGGRAHLRRGFSVGGSDCGSRNRSPTGPGESRDQEVRIGESLQVFPKWSRISIFRVVSYEIKKFSLSPCGIHLRGQMATSGAFLGHSEWNAADGSP